MQWQMPSVRSQPVLNPEAVQAVLDGAAVGASQTAERENPAIIKNDQ